MENNTPLVSILIPVYKIPEKHLRKCIESVINQSLKNIEIIIVDDGSPDNCGSICDEYASNDSRINVIHKTNNGLASARNTAFDNANGKFITFLDGDDFLELNACEIAYTKAVEKNVDLVFWNQYTEYSHSTEIVKTMGDNELEFKEKQCKELQAKILDFNSHIAQVFSKLINREFLIKNNIRHNDQLKQGAEGFIFNILLFEHLNSAYYVPIPLLHYVYNENSISHSSNEENYYMIIRCFEYIENFIENSSNKEVLEKNLYNRILYVIVTTGITGYFNPNNKITYTEKVKGFKKFLKEPLIIKSLNYANYDGISFQRKFILKCIKFKQFWVVYILGIIRNKQLKSK